MFTKNYKLVTKFVLVAILLIISRMSDGQGINKSKPTATSIIISQVSHYWKLDSLANNGLRLYAFSYILESKIDKVTKGYILEHLGSPNEIFKSNKGIEFAYYFYDIRKMPIGFNGPKMAMYIGFYFEEHDTFLKRIREGSIEF